MLLLLLVLVLVKAPLDVGPRELEKASSAIPQTSLDVVPEMKTDARRCSTDRFVLPRRFGLGGRRGRLPPRRRMMPRPAAARREEDRRLLSLKTGVASEAEVRELEQLERLEEGGRRAEECWEADDRRGWRGSGGGEDEEEEREEEEEERSQGREEEEELRAKRE